MVQPKVFSLKGRQPLHKKKSVDDQILEVCSVVALHYPQYTIEYLVNEMPFKRVQLLYDEIQKWRAETLLMQNMIINGPNSKDKNHSAYKKIIKELSKIANK